jgi:hypothetical protein
MSKLGAVMAATLVLLPGCLASVALARPPTIMNSPGYDARLAESRRAYQQQHFLATQPTLTRVRQVTPKRRQGQ